MSSKSTAEQEGALVFIAGFSKELRVLAEKNQLSFLAYLLSMAENEAGNGAVSASSSSHPTS